MKRAVRKHGIGAWEKMRNDPEFTALRCVRERGGRERREEGERATGARAEADATEGGRGREERCESVLSVIERGVDARGE